MANQLGDRQESVPVVVEIFTATGVLAETFTFAGPESYFPNGIIEVAYRDTSNNWIDFPPTKYILQAGGLAVKFPPGFKVPVGTLVRITYLSPSAGGSTTALSVIRDAGDPAKRLSVEIDSNNNPKGSLYALLANLRRQNNNPLLIADATYDVIDLLTPYNIAGGGPMSHYYGDRGSSAVRATVPEYQVGKGMLQLISMGSLTIAPGATMTVGIFPVEYASKVVGAIMHWFVDANPGELRLEFHNNPLFPDDVSNAPSALVSLTTLDTGNADSFGLGIPPFQRNRVRWSLERVGSFFRLRITNNGLAAKDCSIICNQGVF